MSQSVFLFCIHSSNLLFKCSVIIWHGILTCAKLDLMRKINNVWNKQTIPLYVKDENTQHLIMFKKLQNYLLNEILIPSDSFLKSFQLLGFSHDVIKNSQRSCV